MLPARTSSPSPNRMQVARSSQSTSLLRRSAATTSTRRTSLQRIGAPVAAAWARAAAAPASMRSAVESPYTQPEQAQDMS